MAILKEHSDCLWKV